MPFFGSIIDSGTKALAPQSERSGHAKERVASRQGIPFGARTQNHSRLAESQSRAKQQCSAPTYRI